MINNTNKGIQNIVANLKSKLAYIASHCSTMKISTIEGIQIIDSGFPSDTFNAAYGTAYNQNLIKQVIEYYAERGYPFAWWFENSDMACDMADFLSSAGLNFDEDNVAMVCDLESSCQVLAPNNGLVIKKCETEEDFRNFGDLIANLFEPKEENVQAYYKHVATLPTRNMKNLELFVGYVDGEPVSTTALFKTDVAGFYDISTKEELRCKGYGFAMLKHAMKVAYQQGLSTGVLQASPDGLRIYRQAGFKEVGNFQVWNKS